MAMMDFWLLGEESIPKPLTILDAVQPSGEGLTNSGICNHQNHPQSAVQRPLCLPVPPFVLGASAVRVIGRRAVGLQPWDAESWRL
jgi:hypothetical protein